MNLNLKLGPLHLSTKPAEIVEALKSAKKDYLDPLLKIIKDKINDAIERRKAEKRSRLEAAEEVVEAADASETIADFDDSEETEREVTETELDEIERLDAADDCED